MDTYVAGIATDLMLKINNLTLRSLTDTFSGGRIDEASEKSGKMVLLLWRKGVNTAFAEFEINVSEIDSKILTFEVFVEHEALDFRNNLKMEHLNTEEMMQKFVSLRPIVTESITHHYGVIKDEKIDWKERQASRSLKVRFRVSDKQYDIQEDYSYDFDLDEIAEKSFPYVQALYEIHKVLY